MPELPKQVVTIPSYRLPIIPGFFCNHTVFWPPVAFHFFNEEATRYAIYDAVRQTYSGPLSMADDMMVWNITKEEIVERREFDNIRLIKEYVAEFPYSPTKCDKTYRVVVVWKDLEMRKGQRKLFDTERCFFYITNDRDSSAEDIVVWANGRCNQENTIKQQKSDVRSLTAPVDNLVSNWAYMVMASLAWSLKAWSALLLPEAGRWKEKHKEEKRHLLRMNFSTFRNAWINVPAQIIRTSRRIEYRLLSWNQWQSAFFRVLDVMSQPLRC